MFVPVIEWSYPIHTLFNQHIKSLMLSYEDDFSNIIIVTIYAISILVNKVCYKMEKFFPFLPQPSDYLFEL